MDKNIFTTKNKAILTGSFIGVFLLGLIVGATIGMHHNRGGQMGRVDRGGYMQAGSRTNNVQGRQMEQQRMQGTMQMQQNDDQGVGFEVVGTTTTP